MKAARVDLRLHVREERDVDEAELFHLVADWPNAKCGADLSDREDRKRPLFECMEGDDFVCLACVEASNREKRQR